MRLDWREREALRHCISNREAPWNFPRGVGQKTLAGLVAKGWIAWGKNRNGNEGYKIIKRGSKAYDDDWKLTHLAKRE